MNIAIIVFDIISLILFILSIVFVLKYRRQVELGKSYIPFEKKISDLPLESKTVLMPFNCKNCGAAINFNYSDTQCNSCNTEFKMPEEYKNIIILRIAQNDQLLKIQKTFRKFSFLTSVPFKAGMIFSLFLIVAIFLFLATSSKRINSETDYLFESQLIDGVIFSFTFLFAASFYLSLIISMGKVFESFTNEIPSVFKNREFVLEEVLSCKTCGAEIKFTDNVVSKNCMYCGVENYRAKFARELDLVLSRAHVMSANSLIDLEHDYKSRMYELLVVPSVVYSVSIFLPIILFFGIKLSSYF
ncbi:MAG: hypothetical protein KBF99_05725 [Leptospiraceae bacterium]|nr:hypothetical protein [Leptospiraceae bacterium]MBP9162658.1 hypothetical protein [Leptospiraceae bacterium]